MCFKRRFIDVGKSPCLRSQESVLYPLWIHSPPFSTVLCVPGGWPVGTTPASLSCLPAFGCRCGPGRPGRKRRWRHTYSLGSACWPEVGSACLRLLKATASGGQPSPAGSPTAMLSKVAAATPFPGPSAYPCGPPCPLVAACDCPHLANGRLIRLPRLSILNEDETLHPQEPCDP